MNPAAAALVERLASRWPDEFRLGYRFGFRRKADPPCDRAGYPSGFHAWPLNRRNAWRARWNSGPSGPRQASRCQHATSQYGRKPVSERRPEDYMSVEEMEGCEDDTAGQAKEASKRAPPDRPGKIEPHNFWPEFGPPRLPEGLLPERIETFARGAALSIGADIGGLRLLRWQWQRQRSTTTSKSSVMPFTNWQEAARLWVALSAVHRPRKHRSSTPPAPR